MDAVNQVAEFATTGAANAWVWAGNFLVLLIFTVIMILFSYKAGRGGIISLIVSFYIGYALYLVFPYTNWALDMVGDNVILKGLVSLILFGLASFFPFIFVQRLVGGGFGVLSFVPRFALSFLSACFLLALGYHVFHVSNIYTFPEPINTLFAPDHFFFWWFIAPLIGLFFLVH
ncbi:MAG: hypothetical protein WAV21_03625 [Minisyncoccia bacterium]